MSLVGLMTTGHHHLDRLLTSQAVATTRPSSQPAAMKCRCAQGQHTIAGRQWTSASLRGRRAATQRIVSTVVISQLGALRMAVTTAATADTQALMDIRTAAASPREDTQNMTGISAT